MGKRVILGILITLIAVIIVAALGPAEKSLGSNVRVVYLHGAWVWAALVFFILAGVFGAVGLLAGKKSWNEWSKALGRTGSVFWITYLPLSMWAMQTNWNGLFLSEPRWRFALVFAIGSLVLQIGITLVVDARWASAANLVFVIVLFVSLMQLENVMHPSSPIFTSNSSRIQIYYLLLLGLTLSLAAQITNIFFRLNNQNIEGQMN